ncbi:hypothetical protein FD755_024904, partial [Muntiacus reevesi]
MRSLRVRAWGCGKAIKDPRVRGQGHLLEKHRLGGGGVVVQLQVGDGRTRGPCLQRPGGCFCARGWCVSFPFNVLPGGQGCRPSTAGADALRGPSVPEVSSPVVGRSQRGDLAPGSARLAPGHQVALSWRGLWGVGAGLQNLGNTCYVNAALHMPPSLCLARTSCTLCDMRAHVTRALLLPGEVIRPRKDLLAGFHMHQQEDAHEFLMFTLNAMQQGCLSASQPSGHPSEDTTLIRQILSGIWSPQIQCVHYLGVSDTFNPYLDISLDITAAQSVEQALRELVKP